MKKLFFLLCLLLCFTCLLCACDEAETPAPDPTPTHTHEWGEWRTYVLATCTTEGQEKRLCACGEAEMRTVPVSSEHTFTERSMTEEYECNSDAFQTDGIYYYKCSVCSAKGTNVYVTEDAYVYFGEYPQTLRDENVTITETTDSRGYFLGSDGAYYAKVTAAPRHDGYTFSSGAPVIRDEVYYFKVEPIRWRVLSYEDGSALVLCDSIIDNKAYDADKTTENYVDSDIRVWLNDEFYNIAFNAAEQEKINVTLVDNTPKEATQDKVFLLSRDELQNSKYGFSTDEDRIPKVGDYIRATGLRMDASLNGQSIWWIRTIYQPGDPYVVFGGSPNYHAGDITSTGHGVVPALTINLP